MMVEGFGDRNSSDFCQLQTIMQTIEHASNSVQIYVNPKDAEKTIELFCQSPQPYRACIYILECSRVDNAKFYSAAAIGTASIREWDILDSNERKNLISFCLSYALNRFGSSASFVQAKVSSVVTQLLKRGWLDFSSAEKETFLHEVKQSIFGTHGIDAQCTGILFLESLVAEFSHSISNTMCLPRQFHVQCQNSLELDYLQNFYSWALQAAKNTTDVIIKSDYEVPEINVCSSALRFMVQVLGWDFKDKNGLNKIKTANNFDSKEIQIAALNRNVCAMTQPGPAWRNVLILNGHTGWLVGFYKSLRQRFSSKDCWVDFPIVVSARNLITQLCSLTGNVFPCDGGHAQHQHLVQLLSGIIQWIEPPDAIVGAIECGKSESEMLDGCRALLSIANVAIPSMFDQLLKSIRQHGTFFLLSVLTCEVIKAYTHTCTEEETWSSIARDILLDTWVTIIVRAGECENYRALPRELTDAAGGVFGLIVESELKLCVSSLGNGEDNTSHPQGSISAMDDSLSLYAVIGRSTIDTSIPLLKKFLSERFEYIHEGMNICPVEILEEIFLLLLITGHVIADEGKGETPSVPLAIEAFTARASDADENTLFLLLRSVMSFFKMSLKSEMRMMVFSPRIMEGVVWFLARWSCTYMSLSIDYSNNSNLDEHKFNIAHRWQIFGNEGCSSIDLIVSICFLIFTSYPGEEYLQDLTCHLLQTLLRTKEVCKHLVTMNLWNGLANAFVNDNKFISLSGPLQRSLAQTFVISASGMETSESSNLYVMNIFSSTTGFLIQTATRNDLGNVSMLPDVMLLVTSLFERLIGAASAVESRTQRAIFEIGASLLAPILTFLHVYKHEFSVVYLLLKFVAVWVDGEIIYLERQDVTTVVNFSMQLLQTYSSQNVGMLSLGYSKCLLNEAKVGKYKDLCALLRLLSCLCKKDLIDVSSSDDDGCNINISQVVYFGLNVIRPLISTDMLKYPKLSHHYFCLIRHMLEVYPEMITQLSDDVLHNILSDLSYGLHQQDVNIADMCLCAINSIACYRHKEMDSKNLTPGCLKDEIYGHLLRLILHFVLFEDCSIELVSSAADALLPLILCQQNLYMRVVDEVVGKQIKETGKTRLAHAFHSLTSANNFTPTLNRLSYKSFRKNLSAFLVDARPILLLRTT